MTTTLLGACAVGPNFHRPPAPPGAGFTPEPLPLATASNSAGDPAQHWVAGMDVPGQWWTLFQSPALDALMSRALRSNPNVAAAQAALRVAMENVAAQRGAYYPQVAANFSPSRTRDAIGTLQPTLNSGAPVYNLYTAQLSVSFVPDVFGVNRRQVESLAATAEGQRFALEATYLTLTTNLAVAAIEEAGLRAQIEATLQVAQLQGQQLEVLRKAVTLGAIAQADAVAQQTALAQTEATIPPLRKQLAAERDLIAALAGRTPAQMPDETFELGSLKLPTELPLTLPARIVEQRPDVRAAEAQMHAASAQVGVAIGNLIPQISLSGVAGSVSTQLNQLFTTYNNFWSVGASLTQTLFAGGTLWHRKRAADAALDEAGAQYRAAVLAAFQNVADTLWALQTDADTVVAEERAAATAAESLAITRRQAELGSVSEVNALIAQQAYLQAVVALVQARVNRLADTVALFQALGGGWQSRADAAMAPPAAATRTVPAGAPTENPPHS
jgi:NodT family efflux transporter outer membrane factor (OMF) lipoprotein